MERIKKAVERARAARESGGQAADVAAPEPTPAESASATADRKSDAASTPPAGTLPAVSKIQYKQTSVVNLDPRHLEAHRIISFTKTDARTVSFDRLRTQALYQMAEHGWRTLAITSPGVGCGKTTVAINLAMSIAHQTEHTVLLCDLDLRNPRMAEYLGLPPGPSLVDYLNEQVPLSEVFVNPGIPRLTLLPNHKAIMNSAEMMMTSRMKALVSDIRNRYASRLVIFDLPPLLTTDDALAFLPQVDCALMVIENGVTSKSQAREALSLLQATPLLGAVLNKAESDTTGVQ